MRLPIDIGTLQRDDVSVAPFDPHRDADTLYKALDDRRVWRHIPTRRPTDAAQLAATLSGARRQTLVIRQYVAIVCTTSLLDRTGDDAAVEIGATLMAPEVWGTGVNATSKALLLAALATHQVSWVLLRTDERNARSAEAIMKLPNVIELPRHLEADITRPDGSRRISRMFRIHL